MKQRRINATLKRALLPIAALALIALLILTALSQAGTAAPRPEAKLDTFSCDDVTEIPQAECEALVALYNSTDGANWSNNSGWMDTNTPCNWYGVTCSAGHVTGLSLGSNQLIGSIPAQLGNLTNLQDLYLQNNQLIGSIPPELGNLTNLQDFYLHINQLSGSIPAELGNLVNLDHLDLDNNQLSGNIPSELGDLTNLQDLYLQNNQLSGNIPPQLGNLTNLQYLYLDLNQLSASIPPELGNLANLQTLGLGSNQLSGSIPPELGNLASLWSLHLSNNQLSGGIPPQLGNLADLQRLDLNLNQLSGSIPSELGNLANLEYLRIDSNQLSGSIPLELSNLANLQTLWLGDNQLTGSILPELGNLANLQDLYLSHNQLSGSIPPELGNLASLWGLYLSSNQLSGSIPPQLGNLTNLQSLDLSWNQLNGSVPTELSNLTNLWQLSLSGNQLSDSIPAQLGSLTNLQVLNLSWNQLSGSIPPDLANLTNLLMLDLENNQLTGSIPTSLGNLANLQTLYLDNNQLSGSIPPELGNLTNLTWLFLNSNQLSGIIPPELSNLTNLEWLDLRNNQLSGVIPPELSNLTNLEWLDLRNNQLSGVIPPELSNLTNLTWLFLNSNQLSGALPGSLTNLINLDTFWFNNTDLCELADAAFQTWLAGISDLRSTGVICSPTPTPTPVPQDPLTLSASSTYATTEHVVARTSVYNSSSASKTFNVTVSLLKDGATVDSQTQAPTVAGYGTASLTFDFGTRSAGSYQFKAELWEGSTLIAIRECDTTVLTSDDQARALRWVDLLKRSADWEFQEGADLVADTDVDAMTRMGSGLLGKAFSLLIGWIGDLGRAAGLLNTDVDSAAATLSAKLTDLKRAWSMSAVKGLHVAVMEAINAYLSPQQQQVNFKQQEMYGFVQSHAFTWPDGLERTLASYDDAIQSRVEGEEISALLQPPRFIGKSTLTGYRASYDFYDLYGKIFSAIALAAAVGVILISVFVSGGLSLTAIIPALATLRHNASLIALGVTGLLGIIAIGMDTSFEHTVAPAITAQHAQSQDSFRAALESASGVAFSDFTTNADIKGRQVSLATQLRNADGEKARPLVETYIYSPDGRVVEILSAQPDLSPGQRTTLQGDITLPPGPYRAVSAVHTRDHIGLSTQAVIFQVSGPQVQFALSLADPQLTLGEALNATVFITNTDPISGTGELAVIAVSSDEENFQTWTVNLDPGASERLDYSFVPQVEGSYCLDASVSDGYELLARQSAAYVVGAGASLALNYSAQALYDPGLDVTLPVTVANAGTVPTSTTFSLVTLDRLNDLTQVHSQTNTLALGAGADVSLDATALPSAQPGLYTSRLLLDGALHASLDFAVAAEDTLFADIYPDAVFHNVSDAVTLTVSIMDSAYNYTDATTDVTLWRPDGVTETVTMSSIATGQYEGSVTAPITGTYIAMVEISKPNCRAIGSSTYFVAGQRSSLWPTLEGGPILGQTAPLTITVRNEGGLTIEDTTLTLSGTVESLAGNTNAAGLAVLWPTATVTDSYQLTVDKTGFAQTVTEVLVQVITDTVPPWLYLDATGVTNQTPLTVTGGAEAETAVTVNDQPVAVNAQGFFTVTVSLSEGDNLLTAIATDRADNSTTVTQTVNLDTVPPTLTVTAPRDELFTNSDVVTVTGSTEVSASLSVSGTLAAVQPDGSFTTWTLLKRGESVIPVISTDAASNSTTITRTVGYSPLFADFDYNCVINVSDIMLVANCWRCRLGDGCYNEDYDLDKDGIITVVDIMKVAARWGETCE